MENSKRETVGTDLVAEARAMIQQYGFGRVMLAMNGPNADLLKVARILSAAMSKTDAKATSRPSAIR